MTTAFLTGLSTGGSLIVAIGAQNTFVLNQGIRRQFIFMVPLICALSDALLISAGVAGLGNFFQGNPLLLRGASIGGAVFLIFYGLRSLLSALKNRKGLDQDSMTTGSRMQVLLLTLAMTFLNPHVYLDTVILLGSISSSFPGSGKYWFAAGAVSMSFLWFFSLTLGAVKLAPILRRPAVWKILDGMIALVMWMTAARLIFSLTGIPMVLP